MVEFTTSYTIPVQTDGIFYFIWLLLVACAITHHSYVQSTVLEPCSRLVVQINDTIDPLRWSVDTTASTSDVVCRLFGTTITSVAHGQSPAQHVCPNLPTPVRSLFSRVQARRDRPTPWPLFDGVSMHLWSLVVLDAHDLAQIACIPYFTVSCGGTEDTSIRA